MSQMDSSSGEQLEVSHDTPRRVTRARRTVRKKADAAGDAPAAEVSDEIAQARALAQVSQASVVRRQRRAEARAEEALAAPDTASDTLTGESAPAPAKPATRGRRAKAPAKASAHAPAKTSAKASAVVSDKASAAAPTKAKASAKTAAPKKSTRKTSDDPTSASALLGETSDTAPSIPLVDPSLRPHRRGRKPKAYVEAERAAAVALAAANAAAHAGASADEGTSVPARDAASSESDVVREDAATTTSQRDAAMVAHEAHASATQRDQQAPGAGQEPDASAKEHTESSATSKNGRVRREHSSTQRANGQRDDRANAARAINDRANDRNADRTNRRNRQQNRKNRNSRYAQSEPSLSREELTAMKVAELREKAKELDLDVKGKKKAELVEEVYAAAARAEGFRDIAGILDISNEGFGYIRAHGYMPSRDDAFVPANLIRAARLRAGDLIEGSLRPARPGDKFPGLAKIKTVNGLDPEEIRTRPKFSDLTPIYPNEQLKMEHGKDSITGRAIDIVSPIGKGQRGLIVSPPKAGKTTILKKICQSIAANNPEVHLICLLVDERPEEVTDMQRSIKGDVVASTFDMPADNHTRVSELVIERAKRIVELGGDVVVVLDSITRLARAYNLAAPASGRILSGGVDSAALYPPKRFLGAARNIENGGSLTILASALIDTGSKMDEVIFEEFKGTGNMELKLDRDLADRRIFPAIDPVASGTRNEDLLIPEQLRPFVWGIRRVLANMSNTERCASAFVKGLKQTNSNEEFLIRSAKRAQEHGDML